MKDFFRFLLSPPLCRYRLSLPILGSLYNISGTAAHSGSTQGIWTSGRAVILQLCGDSSNCGRVGWAS